MEMHDSVAVEGINFYVLDPYQSVMARDNAISRRTALKLTGAATATALVAGCSDDDDNGNGNGDEEGESFDIEPGTTIVLYGDTAGWEGVEPSEIDGVQNPTLVLEEGEEYEIGWEEGDGQSHNIEIRDEDDQVVDDLATDETNDTEPDDQFIDFEASEEMVDYVCLPHDTAMRGSIEVE